MERRKIKVFSLPKAKNKETSLAIERDKLACASFIEIVFGQQHHRLNFVVFGDGKELVKGGKIGFGRRHGKGGKEVVKICHGRADQGAFAFQNLFNDDIFAVFVIGDDHAVAGKKIEFSMQGASALRCDRFP